MARKRSRHTKTPSPSSGGSKTHEADPARGFGKLALLWVLYFVQGLPFGFQSKTLPLLLRERGFTLAQIGYANLLSIPWTLKFLVCPFLDRWGRDLPFGHRKTWIVPTQLLLVVACAAASWVCSSLELLMPVILAMNVCTATMDVSVDGLALDVLVGENELGWGNVAQTVGYKMGMIVGGGMLLQIATAFGTDWPGFFQLMGGLVSLSLIPLCFYDEPRGRAAAAAGAASVDGSSMGLERTSSVPTPRDDYKMAPALPEVRSKRSPRLAPKSPDRALKSFSLDSASSSGSASKSTDARVGADDGEAPSGVSSVGGMLWRQLQTKHGVLTLIIVFSYKTGEAVSDNMFKPFLLDNSFTKEEISRWAGVYGMVASTLGSMAGGFVVNRMADQEARRKASQSSGKKFPKEEEQPQPPLQREGQKLLLRAVAVASTIESAAQLGRFACASVSPVLLQSTLGRSGLVTLVCYEAFSGGLLTTIIFTYMMASVPDQSDISATHYTALTTVELLGKSIPSLCSGLLADRMGYHLLFGVGAACSASFVLFIWFLVVAVERQSSQAPRKNKDV